MRRIIAMIILSIPFAMGIGIVYMIASQWKASTPIDYSRLSDQPDVKFALDRLIKGDFADYAPPATRAAENFDRANEQIRVILLNASEYTLIEYGSVTQHSNNRNTTQVNLAFQARLSSGSFALIRMALLKNDNEPLLISALQAQPISDEWFKLYNVSALPFTWKHGMLLGFMVLSLGIVAWSAYLLLFKSPQKNLILWSIAIIIGLFKLTLNWNDESWNLQLINIALLPGGFVRMGNLGIYVLTAHIPVFGIVYIIKHFISKQRSSQLEMQSATPNDDATIDAWIEKLSGFYDDSIPQEVQEEAVAHLSLTIPDDQLWKLLPPHKGKGYWENAARVLVQIGFPRLWIVEEGLVKWLQDMNWPGARRIYDLLMTLPDNEFIAMIEKTLRKADSEDDTVWIYWLKELIEDKGVLARLSEEGRLILERAEDG